MTSRRAVIAVGGFFMALCGLVFAIMAVSSTVDGDYAQAAQYFGITVLFVAYAFGSRKYWSEEITPRVEVDSGGTTFLPDRGVDVPLQVALAGCSVFMVARSFGTTSSKHWPFTAPAFDGWVRGTIALLGVGFIIALIRQHRSWRASKAVRLTPAGITLSQLEVGGRPQLCGWDQIESIAGGIPGRWTSERAIVVVVSKRVKLSLPLGTFTPDGRALRELVQFYWQHPASRDELTDGRTAARLADRLARL